MINNEPILPVNGTQSDDDETRREAMIRMAAYTAPVMLAMLVSEKAMAVSLGGPASPPPPPPPPPPTSE